MDLATGAGVERAVAGVDAIVHAASSRAFHIYDVDVAGTRRLLDAARAAGAKHVVYISIAGIDRIPFPY
jgi:nucleoside-diphosphate-sugar epimerase